MVKSQSDHKVVKSAARALDILELLSKYPAGLTATRIGNHIATPLSSLHGLVSTLVQRGFVTRDENSLLYHLGPKLAQIAATYFADNDIISLADSVMVEIRDQINETTSLSVLHDDAVVFTHKRPADSIVQVVNPVGTRLPAHATGSGKAMLAALEDDEIDHIYPNETLLKVTDKTIITKSALKQQLEEIRRLGYAFDKEESLDGVWAIASCIVNAQGHPVAALSIVGPWFRIKDKDRDTWSQLVVEGAEQISHLLGYLPEA